MVTHPERQLDRLREQLETGKRGITGADADLLLAFDDRIGLLPSEYGKQRREKLLRHCTIIAEADDNELAAALEDRGEAERIVRWIHDTHDPEETPETNKDYRIALRMFGKRVAEDGVDVPTDDDGVPESLSWSRRRRAVTTTRNPTLPRCSVGRRMSNLWLTRQ